MKKSLHAFLLIFLTTWPLFSLTPEQELYSQGEALYKAGNWSVAVEAYNNFIQTYPLSGLVPDAQFRKGVCLYRLKQYSQAVTLFEKIQSRYRSTKYFSYVSFWAGMALYQQKDWSRAIDSLEAFVEAPPEESLIPQALLYKGMSEVFSGSYEEARATLVLFTSTYPMSPYYPYGVVTLSFCLYKQKSFDEILKLDAKISPGLLSPSWKNKFNLYKAEALHNKGKTKEAETLYKELLDSSEDIASIAYRRLFLYDQENSDFQQTQILLQKAEEHFSGSYQYLMDFWVHVGVESYKAGNYELAAHLLTKVWNIRDKEKIPVSIPLYLGEIRLKSGSISEARKILKTYLETQDPQSRPVILRLGDLALKENNYKEAEEYYHQYLAAAPEGEKRTEVAYYLAYAYYKQDRNREALELINKTLETLAGGKMYKDYVKLRAYLMKDQGINRETLNAFETYTTAYPQDLTATTDLFKIWFQLGEYNTIITKGDELMEAVPLLKNESNYTYLMVKYLMGLSYVSEKEYSRAFTTLKEVNGVEASAVGLNSIVPYTLFYSAWALYKQGLFTEASELFSRLTEGYPGHILTPRAYYFGGWCFYNTKEFPKAIENFEASLKGEGEDKGRTLFFIAKAYENLDNNQKAEEYYKKVYTTQPLSSFGDDAMYEYGLFLGEQEKLNEGVKILTSIESNYPDSPLVEDAFFKVGELYYNNEKWKLAQEAYYRYRVKYPGGKSLDSALYWGGMAAFKAKESLGAVLLWEILIKNNKNSPYRADAIQRTAEIYATDSKYSQAIDLYALLKSEYPTEAENAKADERAKELRYLLLGLDDQEAKLTAVIEKNNGARTREGREGIIQLAKLYIFREEMNKTDTALNMLTPIVEAKADPATTALAQYTIGEYWFRKDDYIKAGNEFLKAALTNPGDKDLMASSIYRAAEMMKLAGKMNDVKNLVSKLEENFPDSQWTLEGKKLLGGTE